MKVRVIRNTFYNLEYIKGTEGRIIDFKGNKLPSWAEKVKEDKKQENKTPQGNGDEQKNGSKSPEVKTPETKPDEQNKGEGE